MPIASKVKSAPRASKTFSPGNAASGMGLECIAAVGVGEPHRLRQIAHVRGVVAHYGIESAEGIAVPTNRTETGSAWAALIYNTVANSANFNFIFVPCAIDDDQPTVATIWNVLGLANRGVPQ